MTTTIPHFRTPFRFAGGRASVVEQDTVDEIAQCVEAILTTEPGTRIERPEFGTPPQVLTEAPIDVEAIANAVNEWEPRASAIVTEQPDRWDDLVRHAVIRVGDTDG